MCPQGFALGQNPAYVFFPSCCHLEVLWRPEQNEWLTLVLLLWKMGAQHCKSRLVLAKVLVGCCRQSPESRLTCQQRKQISA